MEMTYSSPVDTSLDLSINSHFKNLHQDHLAHALPNHRKEFIFPGDPSNLQVNDKESSPKEEVGLLVYKELNRVNSENKKLTEMLVCMCEKYNVLQSHFLELKNKNSAVKRKAGDDDYGHNIVANQITESSSSEEDTNDKRPKLDVIKNRVSRVLVRTDGSNINSLVQRSVENKSVLVATYEGEHNHAQPCRAEFMFSSNQGCSTFKPSSSTSPLEHRLVQSAEKVDNNDNNGVGPSSIFQQFLVQQMASSLTKDPNFTAALAAAISGRVLDHSTTSHI